MEIDAVIRSVAALAFVVGLMFGCLAIYKKFFMGKSSVNGKQRRMELVEQLYLDRQRKLLIVKKDNEEITILTGQNGEQVVSTKVIS